MTAASAFTLDMEARLADLLAAFKLPTISAELVDRITKAGKQDALPVILEVCEQEANDRHGRRVDRLRKASDLPPGKTFAAFKEQRLPRLLMQKIRDLARGDFLERAANILMFGLPGVGKSHMAAAIGHALVDAGHSVFFTPTYKVVQDLLAAKRDLVLPRALRRLDIFDLLILDSCAVPGYVELPAGFAENQAFLCLATPHNSGTTSGQSASNQSRTEVLERHVRGTSSSPIGPAFLRASRLVSRSMVA
jgi:DNA replication protein DnaC